MRLFIDSAQIEEIKQAKDWGMLDGVTTNPTLIKEAVQQHKKKGKIDMDAYVRELLRCANGVPVSLEVVGTDFEEMVAEGTRLYRTFNTVAQNVYIKIPVNPCLDEVCTHATDGLRAIRILTQKGIPINCTLIFTPEQALLAAKSGARIVSPFVGREDDYIREMNRIKFNKKDYFPAEGIKSMKKRHTDNGIVSGVDLIKQCKNLFVAQKIRNCEILAASIRNVRQFREVSLAGADIVTLPLTVMKQVLNHPKSQEGMRQFVKDIVPEYAKIAGLKKKRKR